MKYVQQKDLDQLLIQAAEAGCVIEVRSKRTKVTHPDANGAVFCACSPSDVRAHKNVRTLLRSVLGVSL